MLPIRLLAVFLSSHSASQVLLRNRRANHLFEEVKPGENYTSTTVYLIYLFSAVPQQKHTDNWLVTMATQSHRHQKDLNAVLMHHYIFSPQETLSESVWRKCVTRKKSERCLNSRTKRYHPAVLQFHHIIMKTEFSILIQIDFHPSRKIFGRSIWVSNSRLKYEIALEFNCLVWLRFCLYSKIFFHKHQ